MAAVIAFPSGQWGASSQEWAHFDLVLGLQADLLPVVSNPKAPISPNSKMQEVGKTPSEYNARRQVRGLVDWTQRLTTGAQIDAWTKEPDYGIALQTRRVRAIDVDIPDPAAASRVAQFIDEHVPGLPARRRANSSKFLLAFECEGDLTRRRIKTADGIIELLATGQQFIAVGTHPSGVRYEWDGGLPDAFPSLSVEQLDQLWGALEQTFAIEPSSTASSSSKPQHLAEAIAGDPIAKFLVNSDLVKSAERDGRLHIECPWKHDHTQESSESATTYWPAHTGGYAHGHFKCLHAHCEHRTDADFKAAIGYAEPDQFEDLTREQASPATQPDKRPKFASTPIHELFSAPPLGYHIKGVLPAGELVVVYGDSGSGKTFVVLDMALAIAQGAAWRNRKVRQGRVVYVCAEGSKGFVLRLKAYFDYRASRLEELAQSNAFRVIERDTPNLLERADALALAKQILAEGGADLIIIDTLAQATPGANENTSEDMGRALSHCKGLHRATHATVLLVHHSGKDATRGARGWSGIKAALDAELEVVRSGDERALCVTKLKDGKDDLQLAFRLVSVELGKDEDGEPVTSCVVQHADGGRPVASRTMGAVEKVVFVAVGAGAALGEDGWVPVPEVIDQSVGQLPFDAGSGARDTRRQRVMRALETLQKDGRIAVQNGQVRLLEGK